MEPLLSARKVGFGAAARRRLDDIDLDVMAGDRLALLGVNGAGKSTLMQILAGVLVPGSGEVSIAGRALHGDDARPRRLLGYLPQTIPAYPTLTVRENLDLAARLREVPARERGSAVEHALAQVQLADLGARLAGQLSAGMLQRLGIAQAIVHAPRVLILDEPTAGLDPLQADQLRHLLGNLPADIAVVLATHLLDDVRQLCDRVALLDAGRKIAEHPVTADIDLLACLRDGGRGASAA